ncbi:pollen allergen Phl p 2-like [Aegilops tauschii subsp. strangulata]|uniref:Expansin-like CBD domain-containing protein n=2 Tax=Aegilops tauschii TaxID=37682 RepID=A0A453JE17_AEGTS|nr:pollen allergen Phl p 2-like [Aegilops tauschii subsp. strangulata]
MTGMRPANGPAMSVVYAATRPYDRDRAGPFMHTRLSVTEGRERHRRSAARPRINMVPHHKLTTPQQQNRTHSHPHTRINQPTNRPEMASSSRMLVAAVMAALVAVAWCAPPPVSFTVEKGSDKTHLALQIKYDKAGDSMKEVELKQKEDWLPLKKGYSGAWEIKSDKPLEGPYSFRYETEKGQRNVFDDVIPTDFKCGATYKPEATY